MNLRTAHRLFLVREHQRAADFQAYLRLLHHHYRSWHVALLLDEDSSHTAKGSKKLASLFDIELIWLPKRSPHLNPIDHLWGDAKDIVSANKQYATIDDQVNLFLTYMANLSSWEALHKAGVLSKKFWLRNAMSKTFCGPA
jgi:transposase